METSSRWDESGYGSFYGRRSSRASGAAAGKTRGDQRPEPIGHEEDGMAESGRKEVNVVTLGRDNYARWRREIDAALRGHGLIWVADGTDKKPVVPAAADASHAARKKEAREWESADSKAQSIIMRTLDDMTFSHVADCVSAKTMMERISELRDPKTTDVLTTGITAFFAETWIAGDDVSSFMGRLAVHAARVNGCKSEKAQITDQFVMAKTMTSLPVQYAHFVQSWNLVAKAESTLTDFREKLLAAERSMAETNRMHDNEVGEALRAGRRGTRRRLDKDDQFRGKCFRCGKYGHVKADCPVETESGSSDTEDDKRSTTSSHKRHSRQRRNKKSDRESACYAEHENVALSVYGFRSSDIIADSGASRHLTGNKSWFRTLRKLVQPLEFRSADGKIVATHVGDIDVETSVEGRKWSARTWADVLYVPGLPHSLYSTTCREDKGFGFQHGRGSMTITRHGKPFIGGRKIGPSYMPFIRVAKGQALRVVDDGSTGQASDRTTRITRKRSRRNTKSREHDVAFTVVPVYEMEEPSASGSGTTNASTSVSGFASTASGRIVVASGSSRNLHAGIVRGKVDARLGGGLEAEGIGKPRRINDIRNRDGIHRAAMDTTRTRKFKTGGSESRTMSPTFLESDGADDRYEREEVLK